MGVNLVPAENRLGCSRQRPPAVVVRSPALDVVVILIWNGADMLRQDECRLCTIYF
jgi:hypothetical protein